MATKIVEMAGTKWGALTIIGKSPVQTNKHGLVMWRGVCKCGKEVDVAGAWIRSGRVRSCGCLRVLHVRRARCRKRGLDIASEIDDPDFI